MNRDIQKIIIVVVLALIVHLLNPYTFERCRQVRFKYKGMVYETWKTKEKHKVVPDNWKSVNYNDKYIVKVKDYKVGKWNATINVNGETIIVGWGPIKHLTFWGSVIFLLLVIIYFIRKYLIKKWLGEMWRGSKEIKKVV